MNTDVTVTPEIVRACATADMLLDATGSTTPGALNLIFPGDLNQATQEQIDLANAAMADPAPGTVLPFRAPNLKTGGMMPVNVTYLRQALIRWSARNTPEPQWADPPAAAAAGEKPLDTRRCDYCFGRQGQHYRNCPVYGRG